MSKLQNIATVWSDSDSETASKTPDELYQTFLDAKNFFEPELKFIEDPVPTDENGKYVWIEIKGVEIVEIVNYHGK